MDQELHQLVGTQEHTEFHILDEEGNIEFGDAVGLQHYCMKALGELYGPGKNAATIVPDSKECKSLFQPIKAEIVRVWGVDPELTDGQVSLTLDRLAMNPEGATESGTLGRALQVALRIILSIGDYSRKDVQRSLRYLNKSVARHTRLGGRRGYLEFIRECV